MVSMLKRESADTHIHIEKILEQLLWDFHTSTGSFALQLISVSFGEFEQHRGCPRREQPHHVGLQGWCCLRERGHEVEPHFACL